MSAYEFLKTVELKILFRKAKQTRLLKIEVSYQKLLEMEAIFDNATTIDCSSMVLATTKKKLLCFVDLQVKL